MKWFGHPALLWHGSINPKPPKPIPLLLDVVITRRRLRLRKPALDVGQSYALNRGPEPLGRTPHIDHEPSPVGFGVEELHAGSYRLSDSDEGHLPAACLWAFSVLSLLCCLMSAV